MTITLDRCDLNVCHSCKKKFDHGDKTYSIVAGTFDGDCGMVKENSITVFDMKVFKKIHFHLDCFVEIAGKHYEFRVTREHEGPQSSNEI